MTEVLCFHFRWYGPVLEVIRCILVLGSNIWATTQGTHSGSIYISISIYFFSLSLMVLQCARTLSVKTTKVE